MPSIVNGLFSGRSGISSHGIAIAVVGDNIANASTIGYKASRSEFEDVIAGGQTSGRVIGSGSQNAAVSTIFEQGSGETTNRALDLSIDGNGFFVVADGDQRFYTRAGNFKVDADGYIVDQAGNQVLGFPEGGSGAMEALSINNISQSSVRSQNVDIAGNLDARESIVDTTLATSHFDNVAPFNANTPSVAGAVATSTEYSELASEAQFSTVVDVFDSLGQSHTVTLFFYKTAANQYQARAYVNSDDVDPGTPAAGLPRQITTSGGTPITGTFTLNFNSDGSLAAGGTTSIDMVVPWNNGSDGTAAINIDLSQFSQFASDASIRTISQDGQGIGSVASLQIQSNGDIYALLTNGQSAVIGAVGLANFANPEGLQRIGGNLLQITPASGAPIVGRAGSGTFGDINAGTLELSTVDIANEFVKLITLQRGFQANSRIITTINQLLNEIIQLA